MSKYNKRKERVSGVNGNCRIMKTIQKSKNSNLYWVLLREESIQILLREKAYKYPYGYPIKECPTKKPIEKKDTLQK